MTEQNNQQTIARKKAFSLTRSAIQATAVAIRTDCRKKKKRVPKGREMLKLAVKRYRSSIEHGHDNYLGTAEPRT